jgi:hypothetical protein
VLDSAAGKSSSVRSKIITYSIPHAVTSFLSPHIASFMFVNRSFEATLPSLSV